VERAALTEPVKTLAALLLLKEYPVMFVADKLGVTRATVYNWLTGSSAPRSRLHLAAIEKSFPDTTSDVVRRVAPSATLLSSFLKECM